MTLRLPQAGEPSRALTDAEIRRITTGKRGPQRERDLRPLPPRVMEVLIALTQGLRGKAIGKRMHVSEKTISTYRARIRERLGLPLGTSDVTLVRRAQEAGFINVAEVDNQLRVEVVAPKLVRDMTIDDFRALIRAELKTLGDPR